MLARSLSERLQSVVLDTLSLGVIVTDRNARVLYANEAAERILASSSGPLRLRAERIHVVRSADQARLGAMIDAACNHAPGPQGRAEYLLAPTEEENGARGLTLCVTPIEPDGVAPSAMILVHAVERHCDLEAEARCLLGLTPTEAKFAAALARGLSLADAAQLHGVSLATARTHMKNIFRKTGACRQSQVAALLRGVHMPVQRDQLARICEPRSASSP